jgi:hypothetical protein
MSYPTQTVTYGLWTASNKSSPIGTIIIGNGSVQTCINRGSTLKITAADAYANQLQDLTVNYGEETATFSFFNLINGATVSGANYVTVGLCANTKLAAPMDELCSGGTFKANNVTLYCELISSTLEKNYGQKLAVFFVVLAIAFFVTFIRPFW